MKPNKQDDILNIKAIEDIYNQYYHITGELSRGGQGVVYKTKDPQVLIKMAINRNGELVKDTTRNEKYMQLRFLPISVNDHITLPLATLKGYEGYVMRMLRDMETFREHFEVFRNETELKSTTWIDKNESFKEIFANYYTTGGLRRRLEAFLKSGSILAKLHANGLVYCDYSLNNVFISKSKDFCNVWLIDADNLQDEKTTLSSYLFTPGIAPREIMLFAEELAQGKIVTECDGCGNSFSSDTYTFAYCLFKQLTFCDPFDGEAYQNDLDNSENGPEAVDAQKDVGIYSYIDDTKRDNTNSFFDATVDYTLTKELRDLFKQTFDGEQGKYWRWLRPTMFEYVHALAKAVDTVLHCKNCGMDFIRNGNKVHTCRWCDNQLGAIVRLKSFYYEGNKRQAPLWYYEKDIENSIEIPLRLIHGYVSDELDDVCLKIKKENEKYIVELDGNNDFQLSYSDDGINYKKCFSAFLNTRRFYLRILDVTKNTEICIIGEVEL